MKINQSIKSVHLKDISPVTEPCVIFIQLKGYLTLKVESERFCLSHWMWTQDVLVAGAALRRAPAVCGGET